MSSSIKVTNAKVVFAPNATVTCDALPISLLTQYTLWFAPANFDYTLVDNGYNYNFTNNLNTITQLIPLYLPNGNPVLITSTVESGLGLLRTDTDIQNVIGFDTFDYTWNFGGHFRFIGLQSMQYIYLGNHLSQSVIVSACSSLHTFQSNETQSSEVAVVDCPSLQTIYLKNCLLFLELGNCPSLKNVTIDNSSIPQFTVDGILHFVDQNNLTNGTINFGGSSAAPSAQGLVYKNNLVSRGYTVTHN